MAILFLDDDKNRQRHFRALVPSAVIVSTAEEAIAALQKEEFKVIFLDHDLGGQIYVDSSRKDTGMEVVRQLTAQPACNWGDPGIVVHTMNFKAGQRMMAALECADFKAARIIFGSEAFNAYAATLG